MTMRSTENFQDGAKVLESILDDYSPRLPTREFFRSEHRELWARLGDAGWLNISEGGNNDRPVLAELVVLAEVWGHHLVPLPFVETLLLNRWTIAADTKDSSYSMGTFALAHVKGLPVVPFGGLEGISLLGPGDCWVSSKETDGTLQVDDFAPSLPLADFSDAMPLDDQRRLEALALYAAVSVGAADCGFRQALEHAKQRQAFGRPIGQFQALKHRFANMYRDLEMARTAVYWAAEETVRDDRPARLAAHLARRTLEGAGQVFGGLSFTWDLGLHFYLRHVLVVQGLATISNE